METVSLSGRGLSGKFNPKSHEPQPSNSEIQDSNTPEGFTISYLRRIPELHLLASRIVEYAYKSQFREQRRQTRSASQPLSGKPAAASSRPNRSLNAIASLPDAQLLRRKIKTLFVRTIQELHRDGAVIISFGACRSVPSSDVQFLPDTPHIWKENNASRIDSTHYDPESIFPRRDDPEDELSEPDDNEDAYIPLTRELLCVKVTDTIMTMCRASTLTRLKYAVPGDSPSYDGKLRPPSPGEIANWLAREEEWRQVGELVVLDALQQLRDLDVVYKVPQGRWQIKAEYLRNQRRLSLSA